MSTLAPLTLSAIAGRMRRADLAEAPSSSRDEMLLRLSETYAAQGVFGNRSAPALHLLCPDAKACWENVPDDARPARGENYGFARDQAGSIVWPWIGRNYRRGGVVVAGLNLRTDWTESTVALEYWIADNDRKQFTVGRRRSARGSCFAYRSMSAAAAIIGSRDGESLSGNPRPEVLAEVMDQIARVQLVKCTPSMTVVRRGTPSAEMCNRCPDRFLLSELRVLAPGALVMFGHDAFRAMNHRPEVCWRSLLDHFGRGNLELPGRVTELFWLPHPSGAQWTNGYDSLLRSLRARRVDGH